MKKLLDLLEQKIQWVVLGLGVLWVLYMAWSFLIQPPVTVEAQGQPVSPGEVDERIGTKLIQDFEAAKTRKGVAAPVAPEVLAKFEKDINYDGQAPEMWADFAGGFAATVVPIKVEIPGQPGVPTTPGQNQTGPGTLVVAPVPGGAQPAGGKMESLPEVPAAKVTHLREGKSNVVPVAANQAQPAGAATVDKFWVTLRYEVDIAGIQKAFTDAKVPNVQPPVETTFVRVVVEREELMPDGSTWGNRTVVPALATQMLMQWPAENAVFAEWFGFLQWARGHVADILQPQFFQFVKGDPWSVPGEALASALPAEQFDANQYIDLTPEQIRTHVPPFTSQQKQLIYKAQQDRKKAEAAGRRGAGGGAPPPRMGGSRGGMGGGAGGAGGLDFGPNDPYRPGGGVPDPYRPGGGMPGGMGEGEGGFMPDGNVVVNANFPLPPGQFNPQAWLVQNAANPTIVCWAHDETGEPGKTYRYRVAYVISNPVYAMGHMCKEPKLAEKFDLQSKFSEWSEKVEVLPTISFWVQGGPRDRGASEVQFQVFRWQSGETKTTSAKVSAGDPIGRNENGVDFATGWTMVDLTWDGNQKWYVLLMDPQGNLHRRDSADISDPRYDKMKTQAGATGASANAASPPG